MRIKLNDLVGIPEQEKVFGIVTAVKGKWANVRCVQRDGTVLHLQIKKRRLQKAC